MLDIQIFHVDRPIYDNGKKIGVDPHLSIGDYTALTEDEIATLDQRAPTPSSEVLSAFDQSIYSLGKRFYAANLLIELSSTTHPKARSYLMSQLRRLFPDEAKSLTQIQNEKKLLKSSISEQFTPEEQVKMLMLLKDAHDTKKRNNEVSPDDDEIFSRGVAECVQTLRDLPAKKKSPLIQQLCISQTHRHYKAGSSRS